MDLLRELDAIDIDLANIERDMNYWSKVDLREYRALQEIRDRLLRDRDVIISQIEKTQSRDIYNRPSYAHRGGYSRDNRYAGRSHSSINNNSSAFINRSSSGYSNTNHNVVQPSRFSRYAKNTNQEPDQVDSKRGVDLTKSEQIVSDTLLKSLSNNKTKTIELKFETKEQTTMVDVVSKNPELEKYLTALVNFLVINKFSLSLVIDSLVSDKEVLIDAINKTPNGEIYSNHIDGFIKELMSKELTDEMISNQVIVYTEPAIILDKNNFDIIDEQLALNYIPNKNGKVLPRTICLTDYLAESMKSLDDLLKFSYSKRILLTTEESIPRHLFLTKVISNNNLIITNN